jgi:hypothetical protein
VKQTDEDRRFARSFADALRPHIERELGEGKSLAAIAAKLGVTAPGLQKQLDGGTPSVRTVALAYTTYRVSVPYGQAEVGRVLGARRKKATVSDQQLFLPFAITAPRQPEELSLKLSPRGLRRYRLCLIVKAAG